MHYLIILLSLFNIPNNQTYNEKTPIIYLERTICYGTCPAYRIEIYNDETGWYDGKKFVKRIGKLSFSVKKQDISNIIQKKRTYVCPPFNYRFTFSLYYIHIFIKDQTMVVS